MVSNEIGIEDTKILKGLAIIAIVFTHANAPHFDLLGKLSFINWNILCAIGLSMFLFLSGYGVFKSYKRSGLNSYWENKIRRVMLPYVVCHVAWLALSVFQNGSIEFEYVDLLTSFIGIRTTSVLCSSMWYISFTWFLYFIFFVSFTLLPENMAVYSMLIWVGGLLIVTPNVWPDGGACSILFPIGVLWANYENKIKVSMFEKKYIFIVLMVTILGAFMCIKINYFSFVGHFIKNVIRVLLVICCIYYVKNIIFIDKMKRVLIFFGDCSYYLYLIHLKGIEFVTYVCNINAIEGNRRLILFIALLCILLVVSFFLMRIQSKICQLTNRANQ